MKKILVIVLITFLNCFTCLGQRDSIKNSITTNVASGLIFKEVGLYCNLKVTSKSSLELSYGHRFHNITIIENGGPGGDYILWKQTGDILRVGYKAYHKPEDIYSFKSPYYYYRLSYWNLHTPKYTEAHGSNGTSSTPREVVSVDKNLINLGMGFGKSEQIDDHFYTDFFLIIGTSVGAKRIHKYSHGDQSYQVNYPKNTFEKKAVVLPTIEVGINVGFFW